MEEAEVFRLLRHGCFDEVRQKLQKDASLWMLQEEEGHCVLHWAALYGNAAFVRSAIEHVEVDKRANNLQTPLMWAITRGHVQVCKILLQAKADPVAKDSVGATPLILAVQHGHHDAMLLLLATCPSEQLSLCDTRGCSAVAWGAYKGDLPALQLLDYYDAEFGVVDDEKMTPLHRAAQGQQDSVIMFLLERGVDPSLLDLHGRSCLDVAQGRVRRRLQRLLEAKPSVDLEMGKALVRRKGAEDLERTASRLRKMTPTIFWLSCVSFASFEYLIELQAVAWTWTPCCARAFELGVPLCVLIFAIAAHLDPGTVPPRVKGSSAVEELARELRKPSDEVPEGLKRLCTATYVIKDLRTKYCKETKACVREFDHFCGWLNTAIGQGNHRIFMLLVIVELTVQWLHFAMCYAFLRQTATGDTYGTLIYSTLVRYPLVCFVLLMHGFSSPGIAFLLLQHLYLVALNLTTNEMINARRYDHFWQVLNGHKVFRNPFNKGVFRNCLEFWWFRERSDRVSA